MRTTTGVMKGLNPTVTIVSKLLLFILSLLHFKEKQAGEYFQLISNTLLQNAKWYLLFSNFLIRIYHLFMYEPLWPYPFRKG